MIKTRIDEYDECERRKILEIYHNTHSIKKVHHHYRLTRNELLSILLEGGVNSKELKPFLASSNICSEDFIIISDSHIGSELENSEYLKVVYDFALKYGISHIFHAGDLLQSTIKPVNLKYMDVMKQVEHLVDIYPESQNIKNHILFGNHDLHAILKNEEILKVLTSRKDFDFLGFKKAYFTWNNYLLSITHDIERYHLKIPNIDSLIRFAGHRHDIQVVGNQTIYVPTISDDLKEYDKEPKPGFLVVYKQHDYLNVISINIDLEAKEKTKRKGIILSKKLTSKYRI